MIYIEHHLEKSVELIETQLRLRKHYGYREWQSWVDLYEMVKIDKNINPSIVDKLLQLILSEEITIVAEIDKYIEKKKELEEHLKIEPIVPKKPMVTNKIDLYSYATRIRIIPVDLKNLD